jgi:hypothetical protein
MQIDISPKSTRPDPRPELTNDKILASACMFVKLGRGQSPAGVDKSIAQMDLEVQILLLNLLHSGPGLLLALLLLQNCYMYMDLPYIG